MASNAGTILVVDDDASDRILLANSLEEQGYSVEVAEDGLQALKILRTKPFDVVLLDLLMPKMNGFQVLERMKAESTLQHIPVIITSAADEMESVVRCIEMGATDHLPKPLEPVLLYARINASPAAKRLHDREAEYLRNVAHLTDWAGMLPGGVVQFDGTTWTVYTTKNSGLPSNNVYELTIDAQGIIWAGTAKGLAKFDGVTWTAYTTENSGLPGNWIWTLVSDTQGNIWMGTSSDGVAVYREGGVSFP